jgi:hypothetical protein
MMADRYPIYCKGDVVRGDIIEFGESVYDGKYPKATYAGSRTVRAQVLKDSYGAAKQQHTFTLRILDCDGCQPLDRGTVTRRKGRNVYRHHTHRQPWPDESARRVVAAEKHARGDAARDAREQRRASELYV